MSKQNDTTKTLGLAAAAVFIASAGQTTADDNPFAVQNLDGSFLQVAMQEGKCGEGKCGGMKDTEKKRMNEGKCGAMKGAEKMKEGKCGAMEKSAGEAARMNEGKCGAMKGAKKMKEGKCGGMK